MEIEIENISLKSNPRTDFGDINELTASIKEKGVLEPILVKKLDKNKFELIAGERRLRASKAAGLQKVPVAFYSGDDTEIEEVKLVENMHRKDFNPVEEAKAFRNYLDTTKLSVETFAQKISKTSLYIEKRLEILNTISEAQDALTSGRILLGHALILARIDKVGHQKKMLRAIIRDKLNVSEAQDHVQYEEFSANLNNAVFDKKECEGCKHNGGEQAMLFESGSDLKGQCLNAKCFRAKTQKWKRDKTKELKEKGVKVLSESELEKLKIKEPVSAWDDDFKKIQGKLHKEPDNYAVVFIDVPSGKPEKKIYCLNPKARRPEKAKQEKERITDNAKDKLKSKISSFKRDFLISKTQELMTPGTKQTKAIALFALLKEGLSWSDQARRDFVEKILKNKKIGKSSFGYYEPVFSKILALDEADMDRLIKNVSAHWVKQIDNLQKAGESVGVNMAEHFIITEDYLKLHIKAQLIDLAKEIGLHRHLQNIGIEKWDKSKKDDLIGYFLNNGFDLKGKIPKLMNARS